MQRVTIPASDPAAEPVVNGIGAAPQSSAKRRPAVDPDAVPVWRRRLLRRRAAARYLDLSPSKLDRLNAAGLCPRPLKIGGVVAWLRSDLDEWSRLGCPCRKEFEARRAAANGQRPPAK